ncbi:MAG TPA: hypothetical protein VF752_11575 [Thermoleophilaceae bacterium]
MDPLRRHIALRAALLAFAAALLVLAVPASPAAANKRASASAAARIVSLARKELERGVREIPDGSNKAPAIWRYDEATTPHWYGAPWCAYFVSYHREARRGADRPRRQGTRLCALHPLVGEADRPLDPQAVPRRAHHLPAARRHRRERLLERHADNDRGQLR